MFGFRVKLVEEKFKKHTSFCVILRKPTRVDNQLKPLLSLHPALGYGPMVNLGEAQQDRTVCSYRVNVALLDWYRERIEKEDNGSTSNFLITDNDIESISEGGSNNWKFWLQELGKEEDGGK